MFISQPFLVSTTNAELEGATGETSIPNGLTAINVTDAADGTFNVTFTADADSMFVTDVVVANIRQSMML